MKQILIILLLFSLPAYATHSLIIVNAADEGSTLTLYEYDNNSPNLNIKTILALQNNIVLSTFATHPDDAGVVFKNPLDNITQLLEEKQIDPHSVPIYLFGTEAMRQLSADKQLEIYNHVKDYVRTNYVFNIKTIDSLPRKMQSLFEWLDVNYLADTFFNSSSSFGTIQMGGGYTGLSFANATSISAHDETVVKINNKNYFVYTKIFENLGQKVLLEQINHYPFFNTCYPIDFPFSTQIIGNFNLTSCAEIYKQLLQPYNIEALGDLSQQKFIVFSDAYKSFDFLGAEDPTPLAFEARLNYVCSTPWSLMKKEYESMPVNELSTICAHSILVDQFIYDQLKLIGSQLWVTDKIHAKKIDWSLGAALYYFSNLNF